MKLKDILVYLEDSPRSDRALTVAIQLAQRFQAYLIGLHVVGYAMPVYDPGKYLNNCKNPHLVTATRESSLLAARGLEELFHRQVQCAGITGEWRQNEGRSHKASRRRPVSSICRSLRK